MVEREKYVLLKGVAGLGNRLVSYCFAQNYADRTGRQLIVDWTDGQFASPGENAFPLAFEAQNRQFKSSKEIQSLLKNRTVYPSPSFSQPGSIYDFSTYVKGYKGLLYPWLSSRVKGRSSRWLSAWKLGNERGRLLYAPFSRSYLELGERLPDKRVEDVVVFASFLPPMNPPLIQNTIKLNSNIQSKIDSMVERLNLQKNTLGVHIRSTDKKPTKDIRKLINLLDAKMDVFDQLYLSTDNIEVRTLIENSIKNVVYQENSNLGSNKMGIHQYAFQTNDYGSVHSMYIASVLDIWALSRCSVLLYQGNSTFSVLASMLRNDDGASHNWLDLC